MIDGRETDELKGAESMETLRNNDPMTVALVQMIHTGEVGALKRLLDESLGLASKRILDNNGGSHSFLHVATDWPGYFPNGPVIVKMLIDAGADPNAAIIGGSHSETPLHWAASSDDVDVADALIDGGADVEVQGASIGGGTPLDDAVGYGFWHVARLLVERGARVDRLWHAAALGMMSRVEELLADHPSPTPDDITAAFWQACHGGQRRVAEYLLAKGADINGVPDYSDQTPLDMASSLDTRRDTLATWLTSNGARSSKQN